MAGWVKYHRKIVDNGLLRHPYANAVFSWLILKADTRPRVADTKFGRIPLAPGQVVAGRKYLAEKLSQSEQNIRTALAYLSKAKTVTIESTSEYSVITIVNYVKYQLEDDDLTNETTKGQPRVNQGLTTVKESSKKEQPKAANAAGGKAFTDYFWAKHLQAHSQKPVPATWAFKKCNQLVQALGLTEAQRRCDNFFSDPYLKTHALEDFVGAPDKWIAKRVAIQSKADTQTQLDRKKTAV